MNSVYLPQQNLSYLFNRQEKTLYVKSTLSVPVNLNDELTLSNAPLMTTEASIILTASTVDRDTPNVCKKEILVVLLSELDSNLTTDDLRTKIKQDLRSKKIESYQLNVNVNTTTGDVGGQTTTTISGDAEIIID